ncbi:MAG: hypothetical protein ACLFVB_06995 [Thermoplasmata archaeon]
MNAITILGLISFTPAALLLYFLLGEYEGYFKDNKAFFMVTIGLGIGLVIGIFSMNFPLQNFLWTLLIVALIEVVKLLIMIQKPFRLNHDTTFYGMALGTGIAAMMMFIYIFYAGLSSVALRTAVFVLLLSYNYTAIHFSTGAMIGYGAYKGDFWRYLLRSFLISGGHGFIMTFVWGARFGQTSVFALLIIGGVFATVVLFYIYNEIIPDTIPDEMKRAMKKAGK